MSTVSSELSQASTKVNGDAPTTKEPEKSSASRSLQHVTDSASALDILLFLIAFRILNALSVKTFFQPDEYFQSLEPAWQMVFGKDSGAWITWVWRIESGKLSDAADRE
jgi:GPI mannosyltransferase 3